MPHFKNNKKPKTPLARKGEKKKSLNSQRTNYKENLSLKEQYTYKYLCSFPKDVFNSLSKYVVEFKKRKKRQEIPKVSIMTIRDNSKNPAGFTSVQELDCLLK